MSGYADGRAIEIRNKFANLLSNLDIAISFATYQDALDRHRALEEFVRNLKDTERSVLENEDLPGWDHKRRQALKDRWEEMEVEHGAWLAWALKARQRAPRRELLERARKLVYVKSPEWHRAALWRVCISVKLEEPKEEVAEDPAQEEQIQLDVNRTPNLAPEQRRMLTSVLLRYCKSSGTRYYQGMHILAAVLLFSGLSESDACAGLGFVVTEVCAGYYNDAGFERFKLDVKVMDRLLSSRLPKLKEALQRADVPVMLLAFDPLLCLFAHRVPFDIASRFWDVLLVEGNDAVFGVLLALLELSSFWDLGNNDSEASLLEQYHEGLAALESEQAQRIILRADKLRRDGLPAELKRLREEAKQDKDSSGVASGALWDQVTGFFRPSSSVATVSGQRSPSSSMGCPQM